MISMAWMQKNDYKIFIERLMVLKIVLSIFDWKNKLLNF